MLSIGPFEQGGNSYSVKQTTLTLGPSMRLIVDFGDFNAATLTLLTGQSGHPASPHYRDHFPRWLTGDGVPLSFAISAPGREKLTLTP
jgi:penicillin amidase